MSLILIIFYTNLVFWLLPPFRQFRTKYFPFFLVLALSDPLMLLLYYTVHLPAPNLYVFNGFILMLTLFEKKTLTKYLYIIIGIAIIALYISFQRQYQIHLPVIAAVFFITLLILIKQFMIELKDCGAINLFRVVVIFYMLLTLQKILFGIAYIETGYLYMYLSNFFQLFMCVYFMLYNVSTSKKIALLKREPI